MSSDNEIVEVLTPSERMDFLEKVCAPDPAAAEYALIEHVKMMPDYLLAAIQFGDVNTLAIVRKEIERRAVKELELQRNSITNKVQK